MGKNTLHRAVLIRSAQRAVIRAEEEEEEREVLESVVGEGDSESDEEIGYEEEEEDYEKYGYGGPVGVPPESQSQEEDDDAMDVDERGEEEQQQAQEESAQHQPLWRKSLDKLKIWPFGGSEQVGAHVSSLTPRIRVLPVHHRPIPNLARPKKRKRRKANNPPFQSLNNARVKWAKRVKAMKTKSRTRTETSTMKRTRKKRPTIPPPFP
jgi:hypothetical protein